MAPSATRLVANPKGPSRVRLSDTSPTKTIGRNSRKRRSSDFLRRSPPARPRSKEHTASHSHERRVLVEPDETLGQDDSPFRRR